MNPMARSVAMLIVKWLLIPAALTAIGYYVVGPRIGDTLKTAPSSNEPAKSGSAVEATAASNTVAYPAPDVEVKVNASTPRKKPRHRKGKRRSTTKTAETKPAQETTTTPPPDDQGGSGGAATTGGDGGGSTGGENGDRSGVG